MSFRRCDVGDRSRASGRDRVALRAAAACLLLLLAACAEPLSPAAPASASPNTPLGVDLGASSRVASLPGQAGEGESYGTLTPTPAVVDHSQMDHSQIDHGAPSHSGGH